MKTITILGIILFFISSVFLIYLTNDTTEVIKECETENGGRILGSMCKYDEINSQWLVSFAILGTFFGAGMLMIGFFADLCNND